MISHDARVGRALHPGAVPSAADFDPARSSVLVVVVRHRRRACARRHGVFLSQSSS